jgi:predicted NBD/HSP70 family sugar kinase
MGIFDASLGAQGNETSGRAILARQQEGDTATFAWIDNLARSIQHAGKILVDMIPRVYDTERVVRILGEDEADKMVPINTTDPQTGQLINDITVGKYDVAITVGASYQTKRLETADSMMQFVQAFPQAAEVAGDLIAKNMDWPGADEMGERLKKTLPPGLVDDEDMPEEQKQAMAAQAQEAKEKERILFEEEVQGMIAERQAKLAKANKDDADAEAQRLETEYARLGLTEPTDLA